MPLQYSNVDSPWYSEAVRTWQTAQDWTAYGADTLIVHVRGNADNDAETLYVAIEDGTGQITTVSNPNPDVLVTAEWQSWQIPLGAFSADLTDVAKMYIGIGSRDLPAAGGSGLIFIDDIRVGLAMESQE